MSENKNVGSIGQMYEDRKSGKTGTLCERDEENRRLLMQDEEGEKFYVSYGAFRSNWRKMKTEQPADEIAKVEDDFIAYRFAGSDASNKPMTQEAFKQFVLTSRDGYMQTVDGVTDVVMYESDEEILVVRIKKVDGKYVIQMLPDVFTFSNWGDHDVNVSFDLATPYSVIVSTDFIDIEDVYGTIVEAVHDINLYGYVFKERA